MPRTCTICTCPDRDDIDRALVAGTALSEVAALFRVSDDALSRHKANHLPATLAKARGAEEAATADGLLSRLRKLNRETAAILKEARKEGSKDNELALKAIARVEKQIELEGRLLGELNDRPQINLYLSPEWLELRAVIVTALAPHQEARSAVLRALEGLGNGRAVVFHSRMTLLRSKL